MNSVLTSIIKEYEKFPQVKAIAIGGSHAGNTSDTSSDIDLYVFVSEDIPVNLREYLVKTYSSRYETGGEYFGSGDEFFVDDLNKQLDVMFWNVNWFNSVFENTWIKHYPSNGYSTAFLYTLKVFEIIYDKDNWLTDLQKKLAAAYPEELRRNIIKRNLMLLKDKPFASYYEQIAKAVNRNDTISVNHRIAAFLASYFDIIFANNKLLHPGEKRLMQYAINNCKVLPKDFEKNITQLLVQPNTETLNILSIMTENLKKTII